MASGLFVSFQSINGNTSIRGLAKLTANGALITSGHNIPYDSIFQPALASFSYLYDSVNMMYKDSSGRIYVGGQFKMNQSSISNQRGLVRLNANLSLDTTFPTDLIIGPLRHSNYNLNDMREYNGHLYLWSNGGLYNFNGVGVSGYVRFDQTGALAD